MQLTFFHSFLPMLYDWFCFSSFFQVVEQNKEFTQTRQVFGQTGINKKPRVGHWFPIRHVTIWNETCGKSAQRFSYRWTQIYLKALHWTGAQLTKHVKQDNTSKMGIKFGMQKSFEKAQQKSLTTLHAHESEESNPSRHRNETSLKKSQHSWRRCKCQQNFGPCRKDWLSFYAGT